MRSARGELRLSGGGCFPVSRFSLLILLESLSKDNFWPTEVNCSFSLWVLLIFGLLCQVWSTKTSPFQLIGEKSSLILSFAIHVNLLHPLTILVPFWFILASSVFVDPDKLLFKGFLPINNNFKRPRKQLKIS